MKKNVLYAKEHTHLTYITLYTEQRTGKNQMITDLQFGFVGIITLVRKEYTAHPTKGTT